ncbi:type II secretion system protein GspL [Sphingomonas sp. FW199]|uniref:type II secretion system protein GspL n=1 Tax=Sphingomonas sp. FW199 TaxID=3400217 RepID=UPI003CF2F62C
MAADPLTSTPASGPTQKRADGVWRLAADGAIIAVCDGPATLLVPTESVRVLAVELPLKSAAKRLEALPYAVEDRIADPLDAVHLALGPSVGPDLYRVGIVRTAVMADWVARAEAAGLGHAPMVPDALALPEPPDRQWVVGIDGSRALVRDGIGGGFAMPLAALPAAWQAAGRPALLADGDGLLPELAAVATPVQPFDAAASLAVPALDLRQGAWQRQSSGDPLLRRLAWIVGLGIAAHVGIAAADMAMTGVIADRRANDTRALVQQFAPGTPMDGDLADRVTAMLPAAGMGGATDRFLPRLTRVAGVIQPLVPAGTVRSVRFDGDRMILTIDGDAALAGRLQSALAGAGVPGTATGDASGVVTVTAGA